MPDPKENDKHKFGKKHSVLSETKKHLNQCSICLNEIDNPAFADGCLHKFCYQCLVEWSKRSNQCPVCRTLFRNVIMNVRSDTDFEQIPVEAPSSTEISAFNIIRNIIVSQNGRNTAYRTQITRSDPNGYLQIINNQDLMPFNLAEPEARPIIQAEAEFAQAVERLFSQFMAFNQAQISSLSRPDILAITPPSLPGGPIRTRTLRPRRRPMLYQQRRNSRQSPNNSREGNINER